MPYPEKAMHAEEAGYPMPSARFLLFLVVFGGVVGLVLLLTGAPFWFFYVAPVLMAPAVVWELRRLDRELADQAADDPETQPERDVTRRSGGPVTKDVFEELLQETAMYRAASEAKEELAFEAERIDRWRLYFRSIVGIGMASFLLAAVLGLFGSSAWWSIVAATIALFLVALPLVAELSLGSRRDYLVRKAKRVRRGREEGKAAPEWLLSVEALEREVRQMTRHRASVTYSGDGWLVLCSPWAEKSLPILHFSSEVAAIKAARDFLVHEGGGHLVLSDDAGDWRSSVLYASGEEELLEEWAKRLTGARHTVPERAASEEEPAATKRGAAPE